MARKVHEVSFAIAGRLASTFKSSFSAASSQMQSLNTDAKQLKNSLTELSKQYKNGAISSAEYEAKQRQLARQLDATKQKQLQLSEAMRKENDRQQRAGVAQDQAVGVAAIVAPIVVATKEAMKFEDAMLGVAKQADGARDAQGNLTSVYYQMRKEIQHLGREIPIATNQLAEMEAAGLRMGIAKDQVTEFTRETSKMATAFDDMTPAEIAEKMGKISNVMQIPITNIKSLGDTINYLDDNSNAKGAEIIGTLLRIGGTAKQVNMTADQAAALGSTFISLGKSEEVAATASNALMRELALAKQQPKRFQDALKQLGMTSEQVNQSMVKDAQGTILKVLDGINSLDKSKQVEVTTGLFGKEYGDDIASLAGGIKEYRRQLALLKDEEKKGSMDSEFQARLQTSSAQMQLLKNSTTETAVALGSVLLPGLNETAGVIAKAAQYTAEFAEKHPALTKAIVTLTGGVVAARIAFLGLNLVMSMNPIGLVVTGVGLLIGAGVLLYKNWDTVQAKGLALWNVMKDNPFFWLATGPIGWLIKAGIELHQNWDLIRDKAISTWIDIENSFIGGANKAIGAWNSLMDLVGADGSKVSLIDYKTKPGTPPPVMKMHPVGPPDPNRLAKYGYGASGSPLYVNGSHANGLSYVPWDGYIAELHKGERVLTASENREYLGRSLWERSDEIGRGSAPVYQIDYSPTIVGANPTEIEPILREDKRSLEQQLQSLQHQRGRVSFVGSG